MRIMTWNINSVRLRMPLLEQIVQQANPDVVALQETKVMDEAFPLKAIKKLGFEHVVYRGEKSYNGVAILSKRPLRDMNKHSIAGIQDARHISAYLPCGTEVHNVYIPAGGDEPDVAINPKFRDKLAYVDGLTDWFSSQRQHSNPMVLLGDFNIAPLEHDVWSHKQLRRVISHTEIEIEKLNRLQQSVSWIDVARQFVPSSEKLYSWWSYRNRDWRKSNRGRRLDHIWCTPSVATPQAFEILSDWRDAVKPSDHAPVFVDFAG